jgi:2-amino-4-hydroxy-6-hydroxymethyldihydropteridine diphosphokinase
VDDPRARAFLAVGSSIRPEMNVASALELLVRTPGVTLAGISTFYWTPPLPGPEGSEVAPETAPRQGDPDFLNGVLEIRTELSPHELRRALQGMERGLGRVRSEARYGPRTMDLDLLLYLLAPGSEPEGPAPWAAVHPGGSAVHPDVLTRSFVALPLLELAPDLVLPPDGNPLSTVAEAFPSPCGAPATELTRTLRSRFLSP